MSQLAPDPVVWKLHCKECGWPLPAEGTMGEAYLHFVEEHDAETNDVALDLVPHCPDDNGAYEMSESGDSGQCPNCGRFDILRVPEQYR